jgi:D-alanyl-D-alanine carboxypeptidase (penicillin-binding protein 5/6)
MTSRRTLLLLLAALVAVLAAAAVAAAAAKPPAVAARAYLVENAATGEVLAARSAGASVPIASITKLMTVLVVLEHRRLRDVVAVDPRAAAVGESTIGLRAGERIAVRDLVRAALIQSANDAADALALSVAPSFDAFARLMNAKARSLGMTQSHFVRPDGLDAPGHVSSARDVTALARAAMRIRFVRDTVRLREATLDDGRVVHTWNDLLSSFPRVFGVKTGHTSGAGWSEVAAARGAGVTIYATLLGGPSRSRRNADLSQLLAWGLAQYRVVTPIRADRVYARVALPYGREPVELRAERALRVVARIERPLTETVVAARAAELPVRRGQVLGHVEVRAGSRLVGRRDLVASRTVNRPGTLSRVSWYAGRTAHNLAHLFS